MLRRGLTLFTGVFVLSGCIDPLLDPDATAASSSSSEATTTASCNPVVGSSGGPGLATCGADEVCIFATPSGFDAKHTGCFPVVASATNDGDACSTLDACAPGQACTDLGCQTLCYVGDACANGASCNADTSVGLAVDGRSVGYCAPQSSCELAGDRACAIGCTPYADGHSQCRTSAGSSARGGVCASDDDCIAGLACDDATKACTTYCHVGGTDCAAGTCLTAGRAAVTVGGVAYGYCSL